MEPAVWNAVGFRPGDVAFVKARQVAVHSTEGHLRDAHASFRGDILFNHRRTGGGMNQNGEQERKYGPRIDATPVESNEYGSGEWLFATILAMSGLLFFVLRGTTPWGWPSLDMATFYVHRAHTGWLQSDFYTTCLATPTGREFFGVLTAFPMQLGLDWYRTLYLWMAVNQFVLPAAVFLGLSSVLPRRTAPTLVMLFALALVTVAFPDQIDRFAVAWWRSWGSFFHPSLFSISAVSLGAYCVFADRWRPVRVSVGVVLTALGLFIHPAYGLGCALVVLLCAVHTRSSRASLTFASTVVAATIAFRAAVGGPELSALDYQRYFAWLHPEHYIPSRFVSIGGHAWWIPFIAISLLLLISAVAFWRRRNLIEARVSTGLFALYSGSLAVQYLFVERWPISASVVVLSPSRFLAFGYWSGAVVLAMWTARLPASVSELRLRLPARRWPWAAGFVAGTLAVLLAVGFGRVGRPEKQLSVDGRALLAWVRANTDSTAVFAADPDGTALAIPLLTGRGLYVGNGFPFVDRCIPENYRRYVQLFGDPTGPRGRAFASQNFDSLSMMDFQRLPNRVDWILRRTDRGFSQASPAYQNSTYSVYRSR